MSATDLNCLLLNQDRIFYAGLLGEPQIRVLGTHTVYASSQGSITLTLSNGDQCSGQAVSVSPYMPHQVRSDHAHVMSVMVEADFVDMPALPAFMQWGTPEFAAFDWAKKLAGIIPWIHVEQLKTAISLSAFDALVFGAPLPTKQVDARIAAVIHGIRDEPSKAHSAEDCAALCHLSASRFLHLFKRECGQSFRTFRGWKRARHLLDAVDTHANLTRVAYELGYSDSAHFSNTIRHYSGLRPKDILAGSRDLRLIKTK